MTPALQEFAAAEKAFQQAVAAVQAGGDEATLRSALESAFHAAKATAGRAVGDDEENVHARLATIINTMRNCRNTPIAASTSNQPRTSTSTNAGDIADQQIFIAANKILVKLHKNLRVLQEVLSVSHVASLYDAKLDSFQLASVTTFEREYKRGLNSVARLAQLIQNREMVASMRTNVLRLTGNYKHVMEELERTQAAVRNYHQTKVIAKKQPNLVMAAIGLTVISGILYIVYEILDAILSDWIAVTVVVILLFSMLGSTRKQ